MLIEIITVTMVLITVSLSALTKYYITVSLRLKSYVENERRAIFEDLSSYVSNKIEELYIKHGPSWPSKEVLQKFYTGIYEKEFELVKRIIPIEEPLKWLKQMGASFVITAVTSLISALLEIGGFQTYAYTALLIGSATFIHACYRIYQIVTKIW